MRIKASINPKVLEWARVSAGFSPAEAAGRLNLEEDRLLLWEAGTDAPSIPQLRKLAELYKRPLAVLYLPEPPLTFQPMHDFRRLPDTGSRPFSPGLTLEIRLAQQRRMLALDLFEEAEETPIPFALTAAADEKPDVVGERIRTALGVDYGLQSHWREARVAFTAWRSQIEGLGVLVFQASRVESEEASGFAIWGDPLPAIVVNRKDAYPRRVFSLLHELAHLMLRQSGVSDLEWEGPRPTGDQAIEAFCNATAAAALMPRELFLAEPLIAAHSGGPYAWSDLDVRALATTYSVSREAVVRRLLHFGRTTEAFYSRKRAQFAAEYQQQRAQEREKNKGKKIARDIPRDTLADFGRPLVRQVIDNYHQDRLSLSAVSGYLGIKVKHLPNIERKLGLD
ncbi:MAG: ImmA/IrrE family metallo-endopeptidase [Bauldia sp.]